MEVLADLLDLIKGYMQHKFIIMNFSFSLWDVFIASTVYSILINFVWGLIHGND